LDEQKGIAHSLLNIGSIWQEYNNHKAARECFQQGLQLKRNIGDQNGEIIALTYLGRLCLKENKLSEAKYYLESAYKQAFRLHLLFYQVETSLMLAQIADLSEDSDNAMHYYKIYTVANDRLLHEKSSSHLTDLQIGLATKEKQALIDRLEQQTRQSNNRQWLLGSGGSIILLVFIPLFIRARKKYRHEKSLLETELEEKRMELLRFTEQLIKRQSDGTPDVQIRNERQESLPEEERLETLQQLSNSRLITEEDWETFKKLFNNVYPFFIVRIRQSNPDITPAELRLSTLILLNLTTREMAGMLGISPESVKKARQRLRKKLELSANNNLDEHLKRLAQEE
jgi:DNA-binding CsgD family transcriptional regulator